ncbi:MAG: DUF2846 domain-containing protein [Gammaproteobacteria bacterium]|nr:DUF2846 domain-containing protein [Gammaproteobacteria bacterium]
MTTNRVGVVGAVVALFLVGGCASGPTFEEYASSMEAVSADNGRIYIYRVSSLGAAIQPKVRINEEVVGKAVPKGFFYVDKPPGQYVISTTTEAERNLSLSLAAGEEKYVRLEVKMGLFAGHVKPVLVDSADGKEELQKTKFAGDSGDDSGDK